MCEIAVMHVSIHAHILIWVYARKMYLYNHPDCNPTHIFLEISPIEHNGTYVYAFAVHFCIT